MKRALVGLRRVGIVPGRECIGEVGMTRSIPLLQRASAFEAHNVRFNTYTSREENC